MSWIRLVRPEDASGKLAELYAAAARRAGKVFGIVRAMSPAPHVLESSMGLYRAVMFGPSELSRAEREFLAVVTSRANRCHY
ncbi:MAG: carboxymuconolactone decarboxylase family protein [Planctomycetes bacterium]|nr:carboxymuconolactone decarboxylase family protein [Planctomycetota bacterium]